MKAKLEMETLGKILLLTAFLIIFLILFKGCQDQMENVGTVGLNEYLCWLSQAMKADLSFLFPSACYVIDVEELQDMEGISLLMRKCWWINGQGEKDINSEENWANKIKNEVIKWSDMARTCYLFTPKEDTPITDFEEYLKTHDRTGKEVKEDSESTTWNYIQKKSTEKTGICFDKKFEDDPKLQKGKMYYIIFYDDKSLISEGERDRILISRDPEFGKEQTGFTAWLENVGEKITDLITLKEKRLKAWDDRYCYSPEGARSEEREEEKAIEFFNDLITVLEDCSKLSVDKQCLCTQDFQPVRLGNYKIKFKKTDSTSELTLINENGRTVEGLSKKIPYILLKEDRDSNSISSKDVDYELTLQPDKTIALRKRKEIEHAPIEPPLPDCKTVAEEFAKEKEEEEQKILCRGYGEAECFVSDECYPSKKEPFSCEYCGDDFNCIMLTVEEWCGMKEWCSTNCKWKVEELITTEGVMRSEECKGVRE